ncbi:MAG: glycosyltransferase family 39 protein [Chloroflexota bacterium]
MTITSSRKSLFILVALLILVGYVQAQNMFHFPYYQDSEGTSIANGWSLASTGTLSPYTYAYNEAPAGSFLMSIWLAASGGLGAFGFSVNSGRVLMLVLHLMSVALLYGIAYKTTKSDLVAVITSLIFAFSPLVAVLQREVILDNIMLVWLLAALYLILGEKRKLTHYLVSALCFGLAVLTKGAAAFFLPAFIYIIRLKADPFHKRFATSLWLALFVFFIAFYPLYAQMKQELFPQGWVLGGDFPHVSLLERLGDRGPETGRFLNIGSGLPQSFATWVDLGNVAADPVLVYGGLICAVFVLLMALDNRNLRPILAMTLAYGVYLLFGGQIFDSAAVILLPFLALNVGIVAGAIAQWIGAHLSQPVLRYGLSTVVLAVMLYPFGIFYANRLGIYTVNQVAGQIEAVSWVKANLPKDALIVTDNYAFSDLRDTMPNAQHYWKVDTDPAVKFTLLDNDVCSIDYVLSTPQVYADITTFHLELMQQALDRSQVLMSYPNQGWPVEVRQVSKQNCAPKTTANPTAGTKVADLPK